MIIHASCLKMHDKASLSRKLQQVDTFRKKTIDATMLGFILLTKFQIKLILKYSTHVDLIQYFTSTNLEGK